MPAKKRRPKRIWWIIGAVFAAAAVLFALARLLPLRQSGRQMLFCGVPGQTMTDGFSDYVGEDTLSACGIRVSESAVESDALCVQVDGMRTQDDQTYVPLGRLARALSLKRGRWNGQRYYARQIPLSTPQAGVRVPVLMYHAVGDDCWGEESLFVKPAELEKQLQYLSENGYETIFFEDLSRIEQYQKPVILTFDDGYDDNYSLLLPLLEQYNMKATVFMIANDIGKQHKLTQAQLLEMTQSGRISIQSHGWSHHQMDSMKRLELLKEMYFSRNTLAAVTGQVPYAVSYPNGKSSERTRKIAGWFYSYGIRTYEGVYVTGTDDMLVERIAVKRDTTLDAFAAACRDAGTPAD